MKSSVKIVNSFGARCLVVEVSEMMGFGGKKIPVPVYLRERLAYMYVCNLYAQKEGYIPECTVIKEHAYSKQRFMVFVHGKRE